MGRAGMGSWIDSHDGRTARVHVDKDYSIEHRIRYWAPPGSISSVPRRNMHAVSTCSQTVTQNLMVHLLHSTGWGMELLMCRASQKIGASPEVEIVNHGLYATLAGNIRIVSCWYQSILFSLLEPACGSLTGTGSLERCANGNAG